MEFIKTEFEGLVVLIPKIFGDQRGYFLETFNDKLFKENGINYSFVQDNQSKSKKGVLRGLHFQRPPHAQGKLVSVLQGSVLDVVVDIRVGSKTYGKTYSIVLDGITKKMMFVPPGFAHGFLTLEDDTIFTYKCTGTYEPSAEGAILWSDEDLNINWGIDNPIVSDKDLIAEPFANFKSPFK